jgi:glycosyltransferase involved in cell wall biosynthesis
LRICIIGKYPPIQGGVSMRTYWHAHGLAALGHEVHVVTNAKEATSPFRMYMRPEDWARCEASYGAGSVTVHWTDPVDQSQSYIPMASPFVTKLAGTAARVHANTDFDVVYSHYLEPYGVAGYLAAQITGVPHVVRMAGSDAGRLWRHPQLEMLYDHVLKSAEAVVAVGTVAERAVERGVAPERIAAGGHFAIPESLFTPDGPRLDLQALRNDVLRELNFRDLLWGELAPGRPHFGVYGKLGERKGSFSLLSALDRLKRSGRDVGLAVLAQGAPAVLAQFRRRAGELGLTDRILQLPFIPHWRVPEFLRGCLAVCCLEQDFPIGTHSPIIPREVLMSGTCLVGSTEVIRKLPSYDRLPHGYGCIAIENVDDIDVLSARLGMIADNPETAAAIGQRGRKFASEWQQDMQVPRTLERILSAAAARQPVSAARRRPADGRRAEAEASRFPLTGLAAARMADVSLLDASLVDVSLAEELHFTTPEQKDLAWARRVLESVERSFSAGDTSCQPLALAIRTEIAVAVAEEEADQAPSSESIDPLFRLQLKQGALRNGDLASLIPVTNAELRIVEFDYDVSEFLGVASASDFPTTVTPRNSYIVVFGRSPNGRRDPLLIDARTAEILRLCNGTRTVSGICDAIGPKGEALTAQTVAWIENLFVLGLVSLHDGEAATTQDLIPAS